MKNTKAEIKKEENDIIKPAVKKRKRRTKAEMAAARAAEAGPKIDKNAIVISKPSDKKKRGKKINIETKFKTKKPKKIKRDGYVISANYIGRGKTYLVDKYKIEFEGKIINEIDHGMTISMSADKIGRGIYVNDKRYTIEEIKEEKSLIFVVS